MDEHIYSDGDYLDEVADKTLYLTRREALFIDDSISMLLEKDVDEGPFTSIRPLQHIASIPSPIDLIEKIGMAVLFTTDPKNQGKDASIQVCDTDLYMLREVALSYIKIGPEPVGYNLKRKIYALLLQSKYQREEVARTLLSQIEVQIDDTN
jgi:hypothetical protein